MSCSASSVWQPSFPAFDIQDPRSELPAYHPVAPATDSLPSNQTKEKKEEAKSTTVVSTATAQPPAASAAAVSSFDFYEPLKLDNLRETLIRLEESIIFALIERAQFKMNARIYQSGDAHLSVSGQSFLSYFLLETEKLHSKVRRYTSPDEHPFFPMEQLPPPILPTLNYPSTIKEPQTRINHNPRILYFYLSTVLPSIVQGHYEDDDENYGSATTCDVQCLQLLSKRIHYGKFVAESKFRMEPQVFSEAIKHKDIDKLTQLITKPVVELQLLERVRLKAATYGRDPQPNAPSAQTSYKIAPDVIARLYELIMAMNKDVQIEYLLHRLD